MTKSKELNVGFQEAIALFLQHLEAKGKSALTAKNYKVDLVRFVEWLNEREGNEDPHHTPHTPAQVGRITVKDYAQFLKTSGSVAPATATANRRIISLKAFFSFLHETNVIPVNPTTDLTTKAIQRQNDVKWLTRDEVSKLFHAIETAPHESPAKKSRDKAVLTLLLNCGLRVSELSNLKTNDLALDKGILTVFSGKGDKFRKVPMGKATIKAVQAWLKVRFAASNYLFTTQRADRMTDRGVQHLFQVLNERTGIEVTPHTCRHTFAKQLADKTGKLEIIADLCGHKSIETTRIYTTPSMMELKKAVESVEFEG